MIKYRIDVLQALKDAGISSYKLRKEKLLGQATITQLRHGDPVSWTVIDWLCSVLSCQPGDLLAYEKDPAGDPEQCRHI